MRVLRLLLLLLIPSALFAQGDVFARARRLVNEGDAKAGRAVVDSVLAATTVGSPGYIEALYWRGVLAEDGDAARTDLLRVAVEYPLSARAADALLRLAQAEFTRGDRVTALRHLDALVRDHPDAPSRAAAKYWTGRIYLEDAKPTEACAALSEATRLAGRDVELVNQIEYYSRSCATLSTPVAPSPTPSAPEAPREDSVPTAALGKASGKVAKPESTPSAPPTKSSTTKEATAPRGRYSVQVAAYGDRDGALSLVKKLNARGYEARVTTTKPWRVRVGHFATRADAKETADKLSSKGNKASIVEAEDR